MSIAHQVIRRKAVVSSAPAVAGTAEASTSAA
jgi:hypothetical protein